MTEGTNTLLGSDPASILPAAAEIVAGRGKQGRVPEGWDGHAAERLADVVCGGFMPLVERPPGL